KRDTPHTGNRARYHIQRRTRRRSPDADITARVLSDHGIDYAQRRIELRDLAGCLTLCRGRTDRQSNTDRRYDQELHADAQTFHRTLLFNPWYGTRDVPQDVVTTSRAEHCSRRNAKSSGPTK